jgi:hypothetical protein
MRVATVMNTIAATKLPAVVSGPNHDAVREHHKSKRCGKAAEKKKDEHYLFLDPPNFK